MSIKIYNCDGSRGVRPIWTLEEMGVDYEVEMLPFPPRVFKPDYLETNILGTNNVLISAEKYNVKKVLVLSTDKASYPINAMGMSKALMEKIAISKARKLNNSSTIFNVTRYGNVNDAVGVYIGGSNSFALDDRYSIQSFRIGNPDLKPEESDNYSVGFVWTPDLIEGLTITYDEWSIEKENTIVLLGRSNVVVNDLINLINYGTDNCSGYSNPFVTRDTDFSYSEAELAAFTNAGICPVGEVLVATDPYANAATRTIEGDDLGIYYDVDTDIGSFKLSINHSETDKFYQKPTATYAQLAAAQESGIIPFNVTLAGFGDLALQDGNYVKKTSMKLNYRYGDWGAQISTLRKGKFYQSSETRSDGTRFMIPGMRTTNVSVYYNFDIGDYDARIKLAVKNIDDERAPLADRFYGFFADAHQDYGRNYYLDFRLRM